MWSFEVNDVSLRLRNDGETCYEQAGVAYLTDRATTLGNDALEQLFVHPVQCQTTYWQRMNEDAIEPRTRTIGKNSDLVYNQIVEAFSNSNVNANDPGWVIVPSDFDSDQLGLLYGILEYKHLTPRGFIDAALVAGSKATVSDTAFYIDLQLHRTVVTQLYQHDNQIEVVTVKSLPSAGYLQFVQRWIDSVAQRSLDETRFDPRVAGTTEQQVFDRLRERIDGGSELVISVEHRGETRTTSLLQDELAASGIDIYDRILSECNPGTHLLLGDHAIRMPGFLEYIAGSGRTAEGCPTEGIVHAVARIDEDLPEEADVELHKSIHRDTSATASTFRSRAPVENPDTSNDSKVPTHALLGDAAYPIGAQRNILIDDIEICSLYRADGAVMLRPQVEGETYVNDRTVDGSTIVSSGDRVRVEPKSNDAKEIVLIRVVDNG